MLMNICVPNQDLDFILKRIDEFGGITRLGQIFETKQNGYFYDNGTGKVLSCNPDEYLFFKWLLTDIDHDYDALRKSLITPSFDELIKNIRTVIEQEKLLQAPVMTEFISQTHKENFENSLDEGVGMITLELTEKCNLRCGYCIYNDTYDGERNFSTGDMSLETLETSIDFLAKHSVDDVAVTFYGGEPLLRFDLVKHAVDYSKQIMSNRQLRYSLTTNLTLMTREMADFFASVDKFGIVCSIDGPEHIHDNYRKYADGTGSFHDAMRGLRYLVDAYKDRGKTEELSTFLSFSMVFGPPYTNERVAEIQQFFESLDWLPAAIEKRVTYPTPGSINVEKIQTEMIVNGSKTKYFDPLVDWAESEYVKGDDKRLFTKKMLENTLLTIHKRAILNEPAQTVGFNGCCVPGNRRLYICTNGDLKPCERMGTCPAIGNVFIGFDKEKIKDLYVNDYEAKSLNDCNDCWAFKICGVCYSNIYSQDSLDISKKRQRCDNTKQYTLRILADYHEFLEIDPEIFFHLNDIHVG